MVAVKVMMENDIVKQIILKGHSGYDVSGKDIVCSSISSIVITTVNGIVSIYSEKSIKTKYIDDCLTVDVFMHNEVIDKLVFNMVSLLKKLEKQYKKNIKVEEVY